MSTVNNLQEHISDFSPSPGPLEKQMNGVKALTFIDYIDKCRATYGDDAVLAAIPTHLKNDTAKKWYQTLVKGKYGKPLRLADDVISNLLNTFANPEANNIWYRRYDPKVSNAYFESFEFAQRYFCIQNIQDLEKENHKLREEIEDLKKAMASLLVHSSSDSPQSNISTLTASTLGGSPQPDLRPLKVDYYVCNVLHHTVLIPYHDNISYDELGPLVLSSLEFGLPGSFKDKDCSNLRFYRPHGEGLITPDIWPLVRAGLKVINAVFVQPR